MGEARIPLMPILLPFKRRTKQYSLALTNTSKLRYSCGYKPSHLKPHTSKMLRLLILFTVVPLVELWLLMSINDIIGIASTIALVLVTGVVGASLARWQGILCLQTVQRQVQAGQLPTDSLLDGLGILVAAAFLVTPGVLTDIVGFALLIPPARRVARRLIGARIRAKIRMVSTPGPGMGPSRVGPAQYDHDRIIDVRIIDSDEDAKR